jgi:hypothetical protein
VSNLFMWCLKSKVFRTLGTIHFNNGHTITAIEARMFTFAELIEFVNNILEVIAESAESYRELLLLFLQVHKCSEKAGNQVVSTLTVQLALNFLVVGLLLSFLFFIFIFGLIALLTL